MDYFVDLWSGILWYDRSISGHSCSENLAEAALVGHDMAYIVRSSKGNTMNTIHINSNPAQNFTMISNDFLDRFLPGTNGDFIKLYLFLLRSASSDQDMTLSSIADYMNCTENDVYRALKYWEREEVLSLKINRRGQIEEIAFSEIKPFVPSSADEEPELTLLNQTASADAPSGSIEEADLPKPSDITTDRLAELGQRDEIRELFFIAQQYLSRPLTRTEMQHICYYYDDLHFSPDLIDYLLEYCISRNHTSIHYVDKVAYNWHAKGIVSVHDARKNVESYHKEYYDILKSLGIDNHHPVGDEIRLMKKWLERYKFPMEIIQEACSRTVMTASKPSLKYADSILSRWNSRGVKTLADIEALDTEHAARSAVSSRKRPAAGQSRIANYNNFDQRSYDYDELERQLANSVNN